MNTYRKKGPDIPLPPDFEALASLLAVMPAAVVTVPVIAEQTGWSRDRVQDAIVDGVAAGEIDEWPEHSSGPAVILARPDRYGLRLEVAGEVGSFAWTWEPIAAPDRDPGWKADRDKARKTTRTMLEGSASIAGWPRPLDSVPDRAGYDPAMIAEHRESIELAVRSGADIRDQIPVTSFGNPDKEPGRPVRRREAGKPEQSSSWLLIAHNATWDAPKDPASCVPANIRGDGIPSSCPYCRGEVPHAAALCLFCDTSGLDDLLAQPVEQLIRQAGTESARRERARKDEEAAAKKKRDARRARDRKARERKTAAA